MVLSREENVCNGTKLDDGLSMAESIDSKRENLVDLDDSESVEGENVADMLPIVPFEMDFGISLLRDPFNMDFYIESTVAAISSWVEAYRFGTDEASEDKSDDDNTIFAELDFIWTSSMEHENEGEKEVVDGGSMMYSGDGSCDGDNALGGELEDLMFSSCEKYESDIVKDCNDDELAPYVIQFALRYLGVKDLLSVERVCKVLRDFIQNEDTVLWRNIHIDEPLWFYLTDDDLLRLTNRARGTLRSLSLMKCFKITNNGLRKVLESNPGLTKLGISGCIFLRPEVLLHDLKAFNAVAVPGIKQLRIGKILSVTNSLFKEFKLLLGMDDEKPKNYKPRFYSLDRLHLSLDDERVIDVEICPRCHLARQVYDCPDESCQEKINSPDACRGCICCINRCISCGSCLENKLYEETFCLDFICFDCMPHLFKCEDEVTSPPTCTYIHQKTRYCFVYS